MLLDKRSIGLWLSIGLVMLILALVFGSVLLAIIAILG
jgi:hypothetical protein